MMRVVILTLVLTACSSEQANQPLGSTPFGAGSGNGGSAGGGRSGNGGSTPTAGTSGAGGIGAAGASQAGSSGALSGAGGLVAGAGGAGAGSAGGLGGTGGAVSGSSGTGATSGAGAGGQPTVTCNVAITSSSVSSVNPTVGIVEWTTDLAAADSAVIELGLDTTYGHVAPVDMSEPGFRTLLLGMKAARTYHFRVVVSAGGSSCSSQDFTLKTGAVPSDLLSRVSFDIETPLPEQVADGYLIGSYLVNAGGPVFILDKDRDPVWWYRSKGNDVFRARMSFDGKRMWMRNTANEDEGHVSWVSMDGMEEEIWEDFPTSTHDLAVRPDGIVALIRRAQNGCDEIFELDPETGQTSLVANLNIAYGSTNCHVNAIAYYAPDDAYIVSDYIASSYIKVSRSGEVMWVLNGQASDFTGTNWSKQHNLHMLSRDRILIFNNANNGQPSALIEYQLNEQAGTAQELWRYGGGPPNQVGGDVQRLPNGNTLGTYCQPGVIQEVNEERELVQELSTPAGSILGHTVFRASLYGPEPRIYDFEDESLRRVQAHLQR